MGELRFSAPGAGGCTVELRLLGADQQLDCLLAELAAAAEADPGAPDAGSPDPAWSAAGAADPEADADRWAETGIEVSTPLVTLSDDETNPAWWVQPVEGPGSLVTLAYALGLLEPEHRGAAVVAHLGVLAELVEHQRAAAVLVELRLDDGEWEEREYAPRCAACWVEPELHAEFLDEAVLERARELADALSLFPMVLTPAPTAPETF